MSQAWTRVRFSPPRIRVVGEGGSVGPPHAAADADRAYVTHEGGDRDGRRDRPVLNNRALFRRGLENG